MVSDLDNASVIDVSQGRKEESLTGMLSNISEGQREGIQAVAMDMWEPYEKAVKSVLPEADIVCMINFIYQNI